MTERKGIVQGMTSAEYHSGKEVSCSSLKTACRSLLHYQAYLTQGSDINPKVALDGNLIHAAILEPMEFDKRYIVSPKFDLRTTGGKLGATAFAEMAGGREPITFEQYEMAKSIQKNVLNQFDMGEGVPETSIFWNDSESGLDCRCRPDWMTADTIIDVKSTEDCRQFQKSVIQYGYHIQQAFYMAGAKEAKLNIKRFLFLVVEKKEPFDFMIYELDGDLVDAGERAYRSALESISLANFTGNWPGYNKEIQTIRKPIWMEA